MSTEAATTVATPAEGAFAGNTLRTTWTGTAVYLVWAEVAALVLGCSTRISVVQDTLGRNSELGAIRRPNDLHSSQSVARYSERLMLAREEGGDDTAGKVSRPTAKIIDDRPKCL